MKVDPLERSKWSAIVGWQEDSAEQEGNEQQRQDRTVKVQRKRKKQLETNTQKKEQRDKTSMATKQYSEHS